MIAAAAVMLRLASQRAARRQPLRHAGRPLRRFASSGADDRLDRVRRGSAAAAEALAFVKANHGRWEQWLREKDLAILGHDPARLGSAAHVLFHNEVGKDSQGGALRRGFAAAAPASPGSQLGARRGCTARLATYNVLCSELSEPDFHKHCRPADLDPETRYSRLLIKLRPEIERSAIICLQEVSREWAGRLHANFAQLGYHFIVDNYASQSSGYMGVALAIPTSHYEIRSCEMHRVADTGPVGVLAEDEANKSGTAPRVALKMPQPGEAGGGAGGDEEEGAGLMAGARRWLRRSGVQVFGGVEREELEEGAVDSGEAGAPPVSTFRGVTWDEQAGKWKGWLRREKGFGRKAHQLGYFEDEEAAAKAVDDAIRRRNGQDKGRRPLNFPREGESDALTVRQLREGLARGSPWELAMRRYNVLLFARLRCVRSGASFCVATYHMPCMYWAPRAMLIQAALAAQLLQSLAAEAEEPYVFLGDFNFTPDSAPYQLFTTATLPPRHKASPRPPGGYGRAKRIPGGWKWKPDLSAPMQSAYAIARGREPAFTNYARVRDEPEFIDTLDYIFVSRGCEVIDVLSLPDVGSRDAPRRPLPTAEQPSDHLLLAATVRFPNRQRRGSLGRRAARWNRGRGGQRRAEQRGRGGQR